MRMIPVIFLFPFLLSGESFKVVSYNVQNLFDLVHDGSEYNEFIPGRHGWNTHTVEIKLDHIADVICDLDADIVALQEIENSNALDLLTKKLARVGCPYRYTAITHNPRSAIQSALISRSPILTRREHPIRLASRERPILEAVVKRGDTRLTVFVNHWKSKSGNAPESRRIASAKVLADRLESLPDGSEYILLGDFNSNYDEYRTLEPKLDDTGGITGINHILHTVRESKPVAISDLGKEKGLHANLWLELPESRRWSHKSFGKASGIDSILIPASLRDCKGIEYVEGSFGVFGAAYLFTKEGWVDSWQYKHGKHLGQGYSDHLPVYASFTTDGESREPREPKRAVAGTTVGHLYDMEQLHAPVVLRDAVVILRRGRNAIIKQSPDSRAIYIYNAAQRLREGYRYDLTIDEIASYKGLKEVTSIRDAVEKGTVDMESYYLHAERFDPNDLRLQNEVFRDIEGVYRDGILEWRGGKVALRFRQRDIVPPEGAHLRILYGQLGYYRGTQLVVHDRNDFTQER